jgi:hypothetical protein
VQHSHSDCIDCIDCFEDESGVVSFPELVFIALPTTVGLCYAEIAGYKMRCQFLRLGSLGMGIK